jgi:uncharacterized protein YbaR (Trm112 family)
MAEARAGSHFEIDVKTLEMLVCPLTKTRLVLSPDKTELISVAAHLAFPIRDGVPMLSLDEARDVEPDQLRSYFPPVEESR